MEQIDLIIEAHTLLPLAGSQTTLQDHAVAIDQGKIKAIASKAQICQQFHAKEHLKRPRHALLPGFINTHTHAPMNLLRGLADDYPLMVWLNEHIWPAEGKFMSDPFIQDGTQLAIAEMIRGGTTCFNDMYFYHDVIARTALETGIRACVGLFVIEFASSWAKDANEYLLKAEKTLDALKGSDLLSFTIAPHAIYSVNEDTLQRCKALASSHHIPIHMHIQETKVEVTDSLAKTGKRPLRRLHELGLVDQHLIAVHMTQIDDEDIEILQATKAHIAHCPQSNMKLASGICPITRLHEAGINVTIGTDSVASNNDLNMLEEMRTATLLAKVSTENAAAIPATDALVMGTRNGAKALGLEKRIGSLEVGKEADLISIDLDQIEMLPLYHPHSQIIYSSGRENVTDVWVKGKALMQNRQLTTIDEEKLKATAHAWAKKIKG